MADCDVIYKHHGGFCLGDCWTLTNYLMVTSEERQGVSILSRHFLNKPESKEVAYSLIDRIAPMLDSRGVIRWTNDQGDVVTEQPRIWSPPHGVRRLPLKQHLRWDGGSSGRIALQLNGKSGAPGKNPPPGDLGRFHALGDTVQLGLPMSLEESIAVMRTCRFMIAVCSGMSHVAHAVGIPLIIAEYGQGVLKWHPHPNDQHAPWRHARGTEHALDIARDYLRKRA